MVFEEMDKVVAFTQEEKFISRKEIQDVPVIPFEILSTYLDLNFEIIIGIGYNKMNALRGKVYNVRRKGSRQPLYFFQSHRLF